MALRLAARMTPDAGRCILLGDTEVDMQTARAGGLWAVAALWGFRDADTLREHGAEQLLGAPDELLPLLAR